MTTVAFPGLGIGPFTMSKGFTFFGLDIRFYGVLIGLGIILAYAFCKRKGKKKGVDGDTLLDLIIFGLPSAVICARIYYVLFSWEQYKDNLLDIFKIWEGGIAIYGAVIGALLSTIIYCKVKKKSFLTLADIGVFGLLIGQIIGRWGNFINGEAYGSETQTALFRMELLGQGIIVHPTFLYESLWNFFLFIFLNFYEKHSKFKGEIFLLYVAGYGVGRFFIEGLRQDSLYMGPFRVSQVLALLSVIFAVCMIVYFRFKKKTSPAVKTDV